jgi:hypothetical protein
MYITFQKFKYYQWGPNLNFKVKQSILDAKGPLQSIVAYKTNYCEALNNA